MKKITNYGACLLFFFIANLASWAQGPNGSGTYYQKASGYKGQSLKTALYNIINSHTTIGYSSLGNYYSQTDARSDGKLWDMYSNTTNYEFNKTGGNSGEGAGWNKEHSVPQSWFNEASPMKSDIVHVIPTDAYVNNRRSNYPYGEVSKVTWSSNNNFSKVGTCKSTLGYSGTVFEPNDEYKGDVARIYFYMVTCYENSVSNWTYNSNASAVMAGNKYPALKSWFLTMLLRWAENDPVSQKEIDRNNAVAKIQGNRNPFVDYPKLEQYIWGTCMDKAFSYDHYDGPKPIILPDIPTAIAATNITTNSFQANWIDGDNATSYTIELKEIDKGVKEDSTFIKENFSSLKSGSADISSSINNFMTTKGWTASKVYSDAGSLKFGSGSAGGSLMTPRLPNPDGHVIVKIQSSTYGSDATTISVNLLDSLENIIDTKSITPSNEPTLSDVTFSSVKHDYKISLTNPKSQRYYLYDIEIIAGGGSASTTSTVEGIIDSYYVFNNLTNKHTYSYRVKGVNENGCSDWTSIIEVTLKESVGLPGDANNDGVVDVADITAIASFILGTTPTSWNADNADVNKDKVIDVADITATTTIILTE